MTSSAALPILTFLLVTLCIGGLLVAVLYTRVASGSPLDKKRNAIAAPQRRSGASLALEGNTRKRSVEDTLREALEKQAPTSKSSKLTLRVRLRQAGLAWTSRFYYSVCIAVVGVAILVAMFIFGLSAVPAVGFGASAGLLLPHLYVSRKRNKRFKQFTNEFPTAVDLIVRGIKSGLPVTDGLKIVASEVQEPVRGEFKALVEDQTLGLPLDEAVQRMADRIPIASARFFAIVIAIQSRTGGNLSETLANLSKVLRERKKMEAKIKSVSSEAKASAMIIGSLPVGVAGIIYVTSPDYMIILFTNPLGHAVMVGCAVWMLIGIVVMKKMINFDF